MIEQLKNVLEDMGISYDEKRMDSLPAIWTGSWNGISTLI